MPFIYWSFCPFHSKGVPGYNWWRFDKYLGSYGTQGAGWISKQLPDPEFLWESCKVNQSQCDVHIDVIGETTVGSQAGETKPQCLAALSILSAYCSSSLTSWRMGCPCWSLCRRLQLLMPGRWAPVSQCLFVSVGLMLQHCSSFLPLLFAGIFCNGTFDRYVCWPHSSPGNVSVPCPPYLPWWNEGNVSFHHFLTVSLRAGPPSK